MNAAALRARIAAMPPEFHLVAACCSPLARTDADAIATAAARGFDSSRLLDMARTHRVEGFVEDGLRRAGIALDGGQAQRLAARAAAARLAMLRIAAEEVRLDRVLRAAGVEPVFVKGATLAMLSHETLALKTSWDIDVFVEPHGLRGAHDALKADGYRPELPDEARTAGFDAYAAHNKDTHWVHPERKTIVELHAALVDAPVLLPGFDIPVPVQRVALTRDGQVSTIAMPGLLDYLCVHGAAHGFERLKWLTDIAALVCRDGGLETIDARRSTSAASAVWLCAELFRLPVDPRVLEKIDSDRQTRRLIALSLSSMDDAARLDRQQTIPLKQVLQRLRAEQLQVSGLRSKFALLRAHLGMAYTPARMAMPRWLLPWHALVWVPWRIATRSRRQARSGKTPTTP